MAHIMSEPFASTTPNLPAAPVRARGQFIPLNKHDLLAILGRELPSPGRDPKVFARVVESIERLLEGDFHRRRDELQANYSLFDPDTDLVIVTGASTVDREQRAAAVFDDVRKLLEQANFRRLANEDIQSAIGAMSHWGVNINVNLQAFSRLEVFARGEKVDLRRRRPWRRFFYPTTVEVPLYQRLAVAFRMVPEQLAAQGYRGDLIYLRLFKNIPEVDVDMVLPGTRVRMTIFDHGRIMFPTVSGLTITGWKLFTGALVAAAVGFYGLLAYLGVIVGTIGYGAKSLLGYRRTLDKYQLNLTQSLYYQTLDSNGGVWLRLLHEAEHQEFREATVAWWFLWQYAGPEGWTLEQLDQRVEQFFRERLRRDVDFDAVDAMQKLERWQLIEPAGEQRWRAVERPLAV